MNPKFKKIKVQLACIPETLLEQCLIKLNLHGATEAEIDEFLKEALSNPPHSIGITAKNNFTCQ